MTKSLGRRGFMQLLLAACVQAACVQLERPYDPVACPSEDLPAARAVTAADLPEALFDPDATAFPVISLEIAEIDWRLLCENGRDATAAYEERRAYKHFYAAVRFQLGDEVLEDVGLRVAGQASLRFLFRPQDGEDEESPFHRCLEALEPESTQYDQATGQGSFAYRPNLKIDFDQFADGREFHGQRRLSLVGGAGFKTLLDEWLPNTITASLGLPYIRTGHAALCINGTYRGLYAVEQVDGDQNWLDDHMGGMKPANQGAYFKIGRAGPQTYPSDDLSDNLRSRGHLTYEPRAGTTDQDLIDLMDLFRVANIDTYGDEEAFRKAMHERIDVDRWLKVIGMETILGDIDGMYLNGNNYNLVRRVDGRWEPVRRDMDEIFYWWWREEDPVWYDWPGVSEVRGPSLICGRPPWSRSRPNCVDGSAPRDPNTPGFTVWSARRPALAARLVHAFFDEYLDAVEDLLGSTLAAQEVLAVIERRAALIEPWHGSPERPRFDPWGPDYWGWQFNVYGDGRQACREGSSEDCIDCRSEDCTLIQAAQHHLQQAALQIAGLRSGTISRECPRDEPADPSYEDLRSCSP